MGSMKRLIHNNMTVSEQFNLMQQFRDITDQAWRVHAKTGEYENAYLKRDFIEERFGIRCTVQNTDKLYPNVGRLLEPRVVDEKKCLFYLISIQ
jgi:hypothetical protein